MRVLFYLADKKSVLSCNDLCICLWSVLILQSVVKQAF